MTLATFQGKKLCLEDEQEQMEVMLIEKGTRAAIFTAVLHKHFKYAPKDVESQSES